ncbi:hypothetical protein BC835DRAFT_263150 [Cytidiella melzeri]|nr:hypothetical protein BC835DRAFT_263150 [Cytidiella melzeri]
MYICGALWASEDPSPSRSLSPCKATTRSPGTRLRQCVHAHERSRRRLSLDSSATEPDYCYITCKCGLLDVYHDYNICTSGGCDAWSAPASLGVQQERTPKAARVSFSSESRSSKQHACGCRPGKKWPVFVTSCYSRVHTVNPTSCCSERRARPYAPGFHNTKVLQNAPGTRRRRPNKPPGQKRNLVGLDPPFHLSFPPI